MAAARKEVVFCKAPLRVRRHQVKREAISRFHAIFILACRRYRQPVVDGYRERLRHLDPRDRNIRRLLSAGTDICMRTTIPDKDIGLVPRKENNGSRFRRRAL